MARDVTARDPKSETALLDRRSARWHAGTNPPTVAGRGTTSSPEPNSAGATRLADAPSTAGEPTPSSLDSPSGAEVRDGS